MNLAGPARRIRHGYERSAAGVESAIQVLERRYSPLGRFKPGPFEGWGFLWQPAVLGFIALTAILVGNCFSDSPFKLELAHTWFFGVPTGSTSMHPALNETTLLFSIVLTFGGLVLLMRVWLRLAEVLRLHAGAPVATLQKIMLLWAIPMIVAPPLFSRDVFSYAAQGELTSHHLSPYLFGPFTIGSGPFVAPVDPLWGNTPAPYGPAFLLLDGTMAKVSGHHQIITVLGLRLIEVAAVAMLAWALPMLARAVNRDPGEAFVLGVMNPVVLLTFIGGAHNDALMVAFLVTGIAFAARRRPGLGLLFVSVATAIKAPAALGLVYIAWTWNGPHSKWRAKVRPFLLAGVIAFFTLLFFTLLAGIGFGWVRNLATNGTVRSWAAPATAVGMALAGMLHIVGANVTTAAMITLTRLFGLAVAMGASVWLLLNADRRGWIRSLGLSLLLFVVLGPVVQPWYLVWGLVLLAVVYQGREHFWLLLLSITAPFIGLPGGRELLTGLVHANPAAMIAALLLLGSMMLIPMGAWTQWSWPEVRAGEPART